ncbi:hypothetical protein CH373_04410 [Leptospira perolatii]|uniref:Uncharacterized protein n=1 Tax=Leptospira perolatii TaxID=2023191 RepID=A0A2M9ZQ65_9LEPT|nr:hypothetical protein [Leptospira perolatii]PJZ68240.1 hypothetical protein CH360_17135 [Leptospira perolatii]PJZ74165.1 hypothetical protein CH373_04410 [Leptospira perolatii]
MSQYSYDLESFRKKLQLRTAMVVLIFLLFMGWNFFQVPAENKSSFLGIFLPISGVLVILLIKNYTKQLKILKGAKIEIDSKSIKQWTQQGQCMETDFKEVQQIEKDTFRGYPRILLVTKQGTYIPLLNLENSDQFLSELESKTRLKAKIFSEETKVAVWKTAIAFLPSIGIAVAVFSGLTGLKSDAIFLVLTLNALLYILSLPKDRLETGTKARRRWIFILLILFLAQIINYFGLL